MPTPRTLQFVDDEQLLEYLAERASSLDGEDPSKILEAYEEEHEDGETFEEYIERRH